MSGESTTYLGNTLVNHCFSSFALKKLGLSGTIIAYGDDGITGYNGKLNVDDYVQLYAKFGFIIKPEVGPIESHKFLSCFFLKHQDSVCMVRDPTKALMRLPWSLDNKHAVNIRSRMSQLKGKTLSFMAEFRGISTMEEIGK